MEKELISLSIKDIETIKEVPDTLKQDLKAFITNAKDTERFVIWLTAQRLPLNLIQRYEYICLLCRLYRFGILYVVLLFVGIRIFVDFTLNTVSWICKFMANDPINTIYYTNIDWGWGQHWLYKPRGTKYCPTQSGGKYIRPMGVEIINVAWKHSQHLLCYMKKQTKVKKGFENRSP